MQSASFYCPACGVPHPDKTYFTPGHTVCRTCSGLSADNLVLLTRTTVARENATLEDIRRPAREQRKLRLLSEYARQGGKRCGACHGIRPVSEYDLCAPRKDGLQFQCRACNKLRALLVRSPGGPSIWRATLATMRAQNDQKHGKLDLDQDSENN